MNRNRLSSSLLHEQPFLLSFGMNDAASELLRLTRHCAGPHGGPVVTVSLAPDGASVQKCEATCGHIFSELQPTEWRQLSSGPHFRWLLASVLDHARVHHDGGWSTAFYLSDLLLAARGENASADAIASLHEWVSAAFALPNPGATSSGTGNLPPWIASVSLDWQEMRLIVDSCCPLLRTRESRVRPLGQIETTLDDAYFRHVKKLLIEAFVMCVDERGAVHADALRFVTAVTDDVIGTTRLMRGLVLDWQLPLEAQVLAQRRPLKDFRVLMFGCSLADAELSTRMARALLTNVRRHGIGIVASQRTVGAHIKRMLFQQAECLVLERLSIRHASAFAYATGATVLESLNPVSFVEEDTSAGGSNRSPLLSLLGYVSSLRSIQLGGSLRMVLETGVPDASTAVSRSVTTFVVGVSPDKVSNWNLIRASLEAARTALTHCVRSPFVVPGAGGFEIFVAEYLHHRWLFQQPARRRAALAVAVSATRGMLRRFVRDIIVGSTAGSTADAETAVDSLARNMRRSINFFAVCARIEQWPTYGPPRAVMKPSSGCSDGTPNVPSVVDVVHFGHEGAGCSRDALVLPGLPATGANNGVAVRAVFSSFSLPSPLSCETRSRGALALGGVNQNDAQAFIVDSAVVKRDALLQALSSVSTLLRTDESLA